MKELLEKLKLTINYGIPNTLKFIVIIISAGTTWNLRQSSWFLSQKAVSTARAVHMQEVSQANQRTNSTCNKPLITNGKREAPVSP